MSSSNGCSASDGGCSSPSPPPPSRSRPQHWPRTTARPASASTPRTSAAFPTGSATLTGGGAYNPETGFVNSAGGFRCTSDVRQGPLAGCLSGEGVRWDTAELLRSTTFKCTGAASRAAEAGNDRREHGRAARRLLPRRRRERRILHCADDRLRRRHRTRHRRDPERLDPGRRLRLRDHELQQLKADPSASAASVAPVNHIGGRGNPLGAPQKPPPPRPVIAASRTRPNHQHSEVHDMKSFIPFKRRLPSGSPLPPQPRPCCRWPRPDRPRRPSQTRSRYATATRCS